MRLINDLNVQRLMSDPMEQAILRSAYASIADLNDPLRCNTFSYILRELLRIVFDRLSPNALIQQCAWFKPTLNQQGHPIVTRADRYRYAISGGISDKVQAEHSELNFQKPITALAKMVDNLNGYTHINPKRWNVDMATAVQLQSECEEIILQFTQQMLSAQTAIYDKVWETVQEQVGADMRDKIPSSLDAISSHTAVGYFMTENHEITEIGPRHILLNGSGSVDVELNYGNNDEDGCSSDDSYPVDFEASIDVNDLSEVEITSLDVDTSSFYE